MAVKENSRVKVISGAYVGNTGKVMTVHDFLGVAIVSFDDGNVGKCFFSELIEEVPAEEIPEGAKKISREDFNNALDKITNPKNISAEDPIDRMALLVRGITTKIIGENIAKSLFEDNTFVTMTESQFVDALWDSCNPNVVKEPVGKEMPLSHVAVVASTVVEQIMKIVPIIFGGEND